ncbi:MAG TPA: MFS transporter [Candidatus Limnocylindrales bacterium]
MGFALGLLAGGSLAHLVSVRLRWIALLFGAVIMRFLTEAALVRDVPAAETLRLPLFGGAYAMLLVGLWLNRRHPGLSIAFVGVFGNTIAIVANGGYMPIWEPSLRAAGLIPAEISSPVHTIFPSPLDASFLLHAGPLGDVIPVPFPIIQNVASIGDVFLAVGLAFFLFATLVREPGELEADEREALEPRLSGIALAPRIRQVLPGEGVPIGPAARTSGYDRPTWPNAGIAARAAALASPAAGAVRPTGIRARLRLESDGQGAILAPPQPAIAVPAPPPILERARRHPYVRLALNGSFTALWFGQTISLFGDRVHQVALAFLVLAVTNSPLAVGLVFVAATLPNLVLGPVAGTLVDRWDQQDVMVVSDLLRAAAVILIPVAALVNPILCYPIVFVVTGISVFFRPARTAVVPRIVRSDELVTANSATWIAESLADTVGYGFAGVFVAFLGGALPLAFWIDAATYVASAVLIASMTVPPVRAAGERASSDAGSQIGVVARFRQEFMSGWRFLRNEPVLLANTIQGAVGQFAIGVLLALTPIYARDVLRRGTVDAVVAYSFLNLAIGVGNLLGGFIIGLVGTRIAKGRLVTVGYAVWGATIVAVGLTGSLELAIGLMIGMGVANMAFVIPSQTLFQERTPPDLIGRVIGFRFSIVFGLMTLAMGVSGGLAELVGPAPVIAVFGAIAMLTGIAGLFVPEVRDA